MQGRRLIDFLISLAPSELLYGITAGTWWRMLCENGFRVSPRYWPRAAEITLLSLANSAGSRFEQLVFGRRWVRAIVEPPIFVLGFWRSGTTHLHNLLNVDPRFACPTTFQVLCPSTFLTTEWLLASLLSPLMPRSRPMDNVRYDLHGPQEDEFAIAALCGLSPYLGWAFPDKYEHYLRYLTLRTATPAELQQWQTALAGFAGKLSWKSGRPIVFKTPAHTARIDLLLQMFPGARFVHIHRDPYVVFQSMRHLMKTLLPLIRLQAGDIPDLDDRILRLYAEVYGAFAEQQPHVPRAQFHELPFEKLEADPVGEMRRLYAELSLPNFDEVEPALRRYVNSLSGYKKNVHAPLAAPLREKVAGAWRPYFERWGYST